jgi:hypothetical protein
VFTLEDIDLAEDARATTHDQPQLFDAESQDADYQFMW